MVLASLSTSLAVPAVARTYPPPGTGFVFTGTGCAEPVVLVEVDPTTAQSWLPEPYEVLPSPSGAATLIVAAANCEGTQINGEDSGAALLSDVGIEVKSPDKSPGQHLYQLWQPTNNAVLRKYMERLGLLGGLVTDATFTMNALGAHADIPWSYSPYSVTVDAATTGVPFLPGANTWWHEGARGTIRISYSFIEAELRPLGKGKVNAAAGSPLAALIGSEERMGTLANVGMLRHYEGRVELLK